MTLRKRIKVKFERGGRGDYPPPSPLHPGAPPICAHLCAITCLVIFFFGSRFAREFNYKPLSNSNTKVEANEFFLVEPSLPTIAMQLEGPPNEYDAGL